MAAGASGAAPSLAAPPAAAVAAAPPGTSDHPAAAAAGEHALESRRFEVAGMAVTIRQDTRGSGALRPLTGGGGSQRGEGGDGGHEAGQGPAQPPGLSRVGLAVWQASCAAVLGALLHAVLSACSQLTRRPLLSLLLLLLFRPALCCQTCCCGSRPLAAGTAAACWTWAAAQVSAEGRLPRRAVPAGSALLCA